MTNRDCVHSGKVSRTKDEDGNIGTLREGELVVVPTGAQTRSIFLAANRYTDCYCAWLQLPPGELLFNRRLRSIDDSDSPEAVWIAGDKRKDEAVVAA
jgi:hypothetical protein